MLSFLQKMIDHLSQIRVLQIRVLQIRVLQIRVLQIHVLQIRVLQIQSVFYKSNPVRVLQYAIIFAIYIFLEKRNSAETSFRFSISLQILGLPNSLPTSCWTAIVTQAANQKYSSSPLSQSLSGGSPAGQKARGLWVRD